jgi:formate dehydrogenase assembly factor FdhD
VGFARQLVLVAVLSLAVDLANQSGLTLVTILLRESMNVFR